MQLDIFLILYYGLQVEMGNQWLRGDGSKTLSNSDLLFFLTSSTCFLLMGTSFMFCLLQSQQWALDLGSISEGLLHLNILTIPPTLHLGLHLIHVCQLILIYFHTHWHACFLLFDHEIRVLFRTYVSYS